MAELMPVNFPVPAESTLATYNFTDVANGLGYQSFYSFLNSAGTFGLTDNSSIYSQVSNSTISANGTFNNDFVTSTFNTPRRIMGTLIANIPLQKTAGNSTNATTTITVYIVSGGVSTQIGTGSATSLTTAAAYTIDSMWQCISVALTTTNFKIGDYIKVNVTITAGNQIFYVGHDPANRAPTSMLMTRMAFLVPFRINL